MNKLAYVEFECHICCQHICGNRMVNKGLQIVVLFYLHMQQFWVYMYTTVGVQWNICTVWYAYLLRGTTNNI